MNKASGYFGLSKKIKGRESLDLELTLVKVVKRAKESRRAVKYNIHIDSLILIL